MGWRKTAPSASGFTVRVSTHIMYMPHTHLSPPSLLTPLPSHPTHFSPHSLLTPLPSHLTPFSPHALLTPLPKHTGKLGRQLASKLLESKPIGSYLVRLTNKLWGYAVSVKSMWIPLHLIHTKCTKSYACTHVHACTHTCTHTHSHAHTHSQPTRSANTS